MSSVRPIRRFLTMSAVAAATILAACAEPVSEPPPPPAPPPAPPPPTVSLSSRLIDQASAYRAYVDRVATISPAFTDGASVQRSLRDGEAYEPHQLLRGAIAYGAVVALQDPAFRAGVRTYAADANQRRAVAYSIMKDPNYVLGLNGAASAAGLVTAALGQDGKKLLMQGRAVKQAAYDVQHYAWSKGEVAGRDGRLALAKQLSSTPSAGDSEIAAELQQAVTGSQPLTLISTGSMAPHSPLVTRSLAVAALAALGYADDASLEQVMPLATEPHAAQCLNMSKLNLYQCLAVAKPHYEDVFCLGQHALADTGSCLMSGAGVAEPPPPAPRITPTKVSTKPRKTATRSKHSHKH